MEVRLKSWKDYLLELQDQKQWLQAFTDAVAILQGTIIMLGGIPENESERLKAMKPLLCNLAQEYMKVPNFDPK